MESTLLRPKPASSLTAKKTLRSSSSTFNATSETSPPYKKTKLEIDVIVKNVPPSFVYLKRKSGLKRPARSKTSSIP